MSDSCPPGLIACPHCDVLYTDPVLEPGSRATCLRCHAVLAAPRADALVRVFVLSLTAMILMGGAIFFPFLELEAAGLRNRTSVMDAIWAFSSGLMLPLSLAVAALIVVIPALRLSAVAYTLAPLMAGRAPYRGATRAFRLAETLRPWAMAEIFIVGVSVALVKVAGLAAIGFGPAFWAFALLVVVTAIQDTIMCRQTIWKSLEPGNS